jgi:hypothetical protein
MTCEGVLSMSSFLSLSFSFFSPRKTVFVIVIIIIIIIISYLFGKFN